uniref:Uncharacterized protein n=1 Tax=Arundo donax TaxID=35708 RepID=A0A0A9H2I1_ARUDO
MHNAAALVLFRAHLNGSPSQWDPNLSRLIQLAVECCLAPYESKLEPIRSLARIQSTNKSGFVAVYDFISE